MVGDRPSSWPRVSTTWLRRQVQLLHAAGGPDGPALVAEVTFQLADDGGGGVGRELDARVRGRSGRPLSAGRATPPGPGRRAADPGWRSAGPGRRPAPCGRRPAGRGGPRRRCGRTRRTSPAAESRRSAIGASPSVSWCRLTRRNLRAVRARVRAGARRPGRSGSPRTARSARPGAMSSTK